MKIRTDGRTHKQTHGRSDKPSYRDARTHLKTLAAVHLKSDNYLTTTFIFLALRHRTKTRARWMSPSYGKKNLIKNWSSTVHNGTKSGRCERSNYSLSQELGSEWASKQTKKRSGMHEQSKQCGGRKWVSGASERANEWASGPILMSRILTILNHNAAVRADT